MKITLRGMEWPELTWSSLIVFLVFVLFFVIFFIILNLYYRRKSYVQSSWLYILNDALKKDLSNKELSVLKSFFKSLSFKTASSLNQVPHVYQSELYHYLESQEDLGPDFKVKLMAHLFEEPKEKKRAVRSIHDIYKGEVCAIDSGNEQHLGKAVNVDDQNVLVRIPEYKSLKKNEIRQANLHIYRPSLGSFIIEGRIIKDGLDYVYFEHNKSKIIFKRNFYLMSLIQIPVELYPWPPVDDDYPQKSPDSQRHQHSQVKLKEKVEKAERNRYWIKAMTKKISERAMAFYFDNEKEYSRFHLKSSDIWEIKLTLDNDFELNCRGQIIQDPKLTGSTAGLFFFKYIDISEEDHKRLFYFIRKHHPKRELLY